jgi:hypothetical protein
VKKKPSYWDWLTFKENKILFFAFAVGIYGIVDGWISGDNYELIGSSIALKVVGLVTYIGYRRELNGKET